MHESNAQCTSLPQWLADFSGCSVNLRSCEDVWIDGECTRHIVLTVLICDEDVLSLRVAVAKYLTISTMCVCVCACVCVCTQGHSKYKRRLYKRAEFRRHTWNQTHAWIGWGMTKHEDYDCNEQWCLITPNLNLLCHYWFNSRHSHLHNVCVCGCFFWHNCSIAKASCLLYFRFLQQLRRVFET